MKDAFIIVVLVLAFTWFWHNVLNYLDFKIRQRRMWRAIERRIREQS